LEHLKELQFQKSYQQATSLSKK